MSQEATRRFRQAERGAIPIIYVLLFAGVMGVLGTILLHWLRGPAVLQVIEFPMQEKLDIPTAVAVARDGTVWFTIDSSDALGVIKDGQLRRISKGSRNVEPLGIGVDSKGNAWVADAPAVAIKRVSPAGEIASVPLGTAIARLGRLSVGGDDAIWFAESTAYSITRLKAGELKRHEIESVRGGPFGVAATTDGGVWGTLQSGNMLLHIAADGKTTEHELPTAAGSPTDIALDASGQPWFLEFRGNKIGVLREGRMVEFPVPVENAALSGITVAPDGSVWFGMLRAHALGRVRNGKVDVLPFPRKEARPFSVAADVAGNIWYADISGYVGKVPAEYARK